MDVNKSSVLRGNHSVQVKKGFDGSNYVIDLMVGCQDEGNMVIFLSISFSQSYDLSLILIIHFLSLIKYLDKRLERNSGSVNIKYGFKELIFKQKKLPNS